MSSVQLDAGLQSLFAAREPDSVAVQPDSLGLAHAAYSGVFLLHTLLPHPAFRCAVARAAA